MYLLCEQADSFLAQEARLLVLAAQLWPARSLQVTVAGCRPLQAFSSHCYTFAAASAIARSL